MGLKMSERKALVREVAPRYKKAGKKEKGRILDEFVHNSGYNRKYAIHILSNEGKVYKRRIYRGEAAVKLRATYRGGYRKTAGRKPVYDESVQRCVLKIWRYFDHMCSKLLKAFIAHNIDDLYRSKWLRLDPRCRDKLTHISAATIDRIVSKERSKWKQQRGRSTTRPGSLLRNQIPIRVFYTWDQRRPGFFEMDTVSHDGGFATRECCHTLSITDVCVGWTELRSVMNNASRWILQQLDDMRAQIPYTILGVDSDNGSEFINKPVLRWTEEHHISFTRGRPYRKNDNCFIEQQNYHSVRKVIGYGRFEGEQAHHALQEIYRYLCPLRNYFYPCVRLVSKQRIDGKSRKTYDAPETPYDRLMKDPRLTQIQKQHIMKCREAYDMIELKKNLDHAVDTLFNLIRSTQQDDL
jgi:hypothetical protein